MLPNSKAVTTLRYVLAPIIDVIANPPGSTVPYHLDYRLQRVHNRRLFREVGVNRVASVGFRAGSGFANAYEEHRAVAQTRESILQSGFQIKNGEKITSWQWLYARYGESRCVFLNDSITSSEGRTILKNPGEVRNWHVPALDLNTKLRLHKYAARMDLMLSKSVPILQCIPEQERVSLNNGSEEVQTSTAYIRKINDVTSTSSGIIMTDGCAPAGLNVINAAACALSSSSNIHSNGTSSVCAIQGRLGGYKGMWYLDHSLPPDVICVRPSMLKIDLDDKASTVSQKQFEALKASNRFANRAGTINKQFALLLEGWGVSQYVLLKLTGEVIRPILNMTRSRTDAETTLIRQLHSTDSPFLQELENEAVMMLKANLWGEYRLQFLLNKIRILRLRALARKPRLLVEKSRTAFILADPTGLLQPGEVYFKGIDEQSPNSALSGKVILLRNPCYSPDHLVVATAVSSLSIRGKTESEKAKVRLIESSLCGVILFSVHGNEPMAQKLSGGDYDGDIAWLCWDSRIVDPIAQSQQDNDKVAATLKTRFPNLGDRLDQPKPISTEEPSTWPPTSAALQRLWLSSLNNNQLGIASKLHSALIDSMLSRSTSPQPLDSALLEKSVLYDSRAIHLAQLCDANVDTPKTGVTWPVPSHLHTEVMKQVRENSSSRSGWGQIQTVLQAFAGVSDTDKNVESTLLMIAKSNGIQGIVLSEEEPSELSGLQETRFFEKGWRQEDTPQPHPLLMECAEHLGWVRYKKVAEIHMAIFAREVMSGPPPQWKPKSDTNIVNDNVDSDSDEEISATNSINDVWEAINFGSIIDSVPRKMSKVKDEIDEPSFEKGRSPPEKWTNIRNWCLPRARKRLHFEDGAAGKKPRSIADQKALALAYYVVSWQNFHRRTNVSAFPKAFPFSVAADIICEAVISYNSKGDRGYM